MAVAALALAGCGGAPAVPVSDYEVLTAFPHDAAAYTQGLIFHEGHLYESTGRYGESSLRKVHIESGRIVDSVAVDSAFFAEGLARVGSELYQLTWREGVAIVYDLETLERRRKFTYEGEGWGLCHDGRSLWMSDGSATLTRRDPATFEPLGELEVTAGGRPLAALNELECVGDAIWANVYQTDRIVRIDPATGEVTTELDGRQLSVIGGRPPGVDAVLNGIAFIPETGVFLLTGKLWGRVLAVRVAGASEDGS